jgi:PPOX class probable F420-dependent enzyme
VTSFDEDEARRRFAAGRVARMASVTQEGKPHLVPIVFAVDRDIIYSAVDEKPKRTPELKRLRNIAANPNVTLLVDEYDDDWNRVWWTRADGAATVHESGAVRERGVVILSEKYEQYRTWPESLGAVVKIDVERWSGWSFA